MVMMQLAREQCLWLCLPDYEDCIKKAISMGGDADTLAAIAGPIAYAFYRHIPERLLRQAYRILPQKMLEISCRFDALANIPL